MSEKEKIYFAKVNPNAIIPTKRDEDAGYDIFGIIDEDIEIPLNGIRFIDTGIVSSFSSDYYMQFFDRSSSGSKGLSVLCGVIDSGFRAEWKVVINNTSNRTIVLSNDVEKSRNQRIKGLTEKGIEYIDAFYIFYDMKKKAICQSIFLPVPKTEVIETTVDEINKFISERGTNMLGSTNK